ncbi:MAG: 50S ribosomal protein L2 [Patescibacteria group bacterium]
MAIKLYKPTSPGRRGASSIPHTSFADKRPERSLVTPLSKSGGRNAQGKITVRHRGGGHKRLYRIIDFRQDRFDVPAKVIAVEYDPNRTSAIALVEYPDKERRYIPAPVDIHQGTTVMSSMHKIEATPGNRMPLSYIPTGKPVYNIELVPGQGGKIVRSAGTNAIVMNVEGDFAQVKLPSGEIRLFPKEACASVGQVSNPDKRLVRLGKAGRMRHLGWRPEVRGKAMNPVDHPHGGGEGHNPIGMKFPKTPWGKPAFGVPTRNKGKWTNRFIVKKRS